MVDKNWEVSLNPADLPPAKPAMYAVHRAKTIEGMKAAGCKGPIIVWGLPPFERPPCDYEGGFRNESLYLWLTGVNEPDCAVIIDLDGNSTLVFHDLDPASVMWTGPHPTVDQLKADYGFSKVIFMKDLPAIIEKAPCVYTLGETLPSSYDRSKFNVELLLEVVGNLRQVKSADEVQYIQWACDANSIAFHKVFGAMRPGMTSGEIVGILSKTWHTYGCPNLGFQPIVSCGKRAAILHGRPSGIMEDGTLVVVDAGCEYFGYCSDNTRTFPVNGKFTETQRAVYQAVLDSHNAVIAAVKPGMWWPDVGQLSALAMAPGLIKLGLLKGTPEEVVGAGALGAFYPHGLGHGMGLDVHEICGWPKGTERPPEFHRARVRFGRKLEEGVVITVEPGCYFLPELFEPYRERPEAAKHIDFDLARRFVTEVGGIRIEDDIVVTKDGCRVLSKIPKEVDDIERFMAAAKARKAKK